MYYPLSHPIQFSHSYAVLSLYSGTQSATDSIYLLVMFFYTPQMSTTLGAYPSSLDYCVQPDALQFQVENFDRKLQGSELTS